MCFFRLGAAATLTLVLVACAGWMIGSVYLLLHQPLGFGPKRLLRAHATFGSNHPPKAPRALLPGTGDIDASAAWFDAIAAGAGTDRDRPARQSRRTARSGGNAASRISRLR